MPAGNIGEDLMCDPIGKEVDHPARKSSTTLHSRAMRTTSSYHFLYYLFCSFCRLHERLHLCPSLETVHSGKFVLNFNGYFNTNFGSKHLIRPCTPGDESYWPTRGTNHSWGSNTFANQYARSYRRNYHALNLEKSKKNSFMWNTYPRMNVMWISSARNLK